MKKTTTFKEKVAMIWTFPLMAIAAVGFAALTFVLYFGVYLMNVTGTTGAALYIIDRLRLKLTDIRLKRLIKKDEKLYKFGSSKLKKYEDTTSAAN